MTRIREAIKAELRRHLDALRVIPKTAVLIYGVGVLALLFIVGSLIVRIRTMCAGGLFLALFIGLVILTLLLTKRGYSMDRRR